MKSFKLLEDIAELSKEGKEGRECYAFSDVEDKAIKFLLEYAENLFAKYGVGEGDYEIKTDAIGNLYVTLFGEDRESTVVSGSHVDSVQNGGDFDGVLGVNSAFRFLEKLLQQGSQALAGGNEQRSMYVQNVMPGQERARARSGALKPKKNYMVVVFRAEESSPKTGVACLGSRVATGTISEEELENIRYRDENGNLVPLREHFLKYGDAAWQHVLEEIRKPPIDAKKMKAYEELHIEQSAVLEKENADLGIVVTGIGGAIRERVKIILKKNMIGRLNVNQENPVQRLRYSFKGEAAHTGGTPPNKHAKKLPSGSGWYRKDALMAAIKFLNLIKKEFGDRMPKLLALDVPEKTGFTTVPEWQNLDLIVSDNDLAKNLARLNKIARDVTMDTGVAICYENFSLEEGEYEYLDDECMPLIQFPQFVERTVRRAVHGNGDSGVGEVRATVTDFSVSKEGLSCNLDFRDVNTEKMNAILGAVHGKIKGILRKLHYGQNEIEQTIETISAKKFIPLDKRAVETKRKLVGQKGLRAIEMPSLPGHDAGSVAMAGVPVSMTFVRHDGISHSHHEQVDQGYYLKAEGVSHAYLESLLGLKKLPATRSTSPKSAAGESAGETTSSAPGSAAA